jgi:hypothetical protein
MTEKRYAYPIDKEQREQLLAIKAATGASFGWMITCAIAEWLDKHAVPGSVAGDALGLGARVTPPRELERD